MPISPPFSPHALQVADIDGSAAEQVADAIRGAGGRAAAAQCDVADPQQQLAAFQRHMRQWGRLDYALLNAGIGERGDLIWCKGDSWQQTLDVDLRAVMEGVRLAARAMLTGNPQGSRSDIPAGGMRSSGSSGVIMITASAGGVFPMPLRCATAGGSSSSQPAGWGG